MKRLLSLLLAALIVTNLMIGCNEKEESSEEEEKTTEEKDTPKVGDAKEVLRNINARRAIAMAFDKQFIVEEILGDGSRPINYFVPYGFYKDAQGKDFRDKYPDGWNGYDPVKAAELWAEAKGEVGFDTVEIELLNFDHEKAKKIGEYIKAQVEEVLKGLTLAINIQTFENQLDLINRGLYDISLSGWAPDYPDPLTFLDKWVTGSRLNKIGFSNKEYDQLINNCISGEYVKDSNARQEAMQEAERILLEDFAALAPITQNGITFVQKPYINGILYHRYGGNFTYKRASTTKEGANGTLVLTDTADIPTMNSITATDLISYTALVNTFEGLVMFGENDIIEPGVAKSWEVSEDGLKYTFYLRNNALWSNGDKVTANDFVYAIRKLVTSKEAGYTSIAEVARIKNASKVKVGELDDSELGVVAIDEKTVVFELDVAVPYFLKLLTFPAFYPQNQDFVDKQGNAYGTTNETTVFNGAFVLSAWEIGNEYVFKKNEKYWDAANTSCEGVNFKIVKEVSMAVNLYEAGEVDRIFLDVDHLQNYLDNPNLTVLEEGVITYLMFNQGFEGFYEEY